MLDLYWLSDDAWARLEPHMPHNQPGRPRVDDRRMISGILHILKTGARWRDVPPEYGPAKTIYNRYESWARRGVWQRIFAKVAAAGAIPDELMLDSSHVKAHRSASGGKGGSGRRRLAYRGVAERPKIHCLADTCGRIVAVALTPGNIANISMAIPLLDAIAPTKRLLAAKAYDADRLRKWLGDKRIEAVIPGRATRNAAYPLNRPAYRRRNIIERMFGGLKNWKRIATRYDRLAVNFLAAIALVALATQWLK